ncbi:MAG: FkbM family methyltransferase [Saprospiraceae bacterium]|jgi:FkbM family methyltransferase
MLENVLRKIEAKHGTFNALDEDLITEQLIAYSAHTRNELSMVVDHIDVSDVILDIGAHIGTYSIPMAKKAAKGKVWSIEADLSTYDLLVMNIQENELQDRISAYNFLASDGNDNYTQGPGIENNSGANYYLPSKEKSEFRGTDINLWLEELNLPDIHFIKLDIEGMEYQVLSSIKEYLINHRPKLYIEVVQNQLSRMGDTPQKIQNLLDSIGYRYFVNTYHRNSNEDQYIKTEISDFGFSSFFDVLALPLK